MTDLYNNFLRAHMTSQELATILQGMKSSLDPQTPIIIIIIIINWKTLRNVFSETRVLSPKWDTNIKSLPSGLGDLQGRRGREIVRATHGGWPQGNRVFQTQHGITHRTHSSYKSVHRAICISSSRQTSLHREGRVGKLRSCRERDNQFSLMT